MAPGHDGLQSMLFSIVCFRFAAQNKLYGTVVDMEHHLVRKEGSGFEAQEFFEFPERYGSTFSVKVHVRQ